MRAAARPASALAGPWGRLSLFVRAQMIGWSLFALVDLVNRQLAYRHFPATLVLTAVACVLLLALTCGFRAIYNRHFPGSGLRPPVALVIGLLSGAGSAVAVAAIVVFRHAFGWNLPDWGPVEEIVLPFLHYLVVLVGWSLLFFWIRAERLRLIEHEAASLAQAEALRAEIQQLRLQINPHFLFNALNGIAEEVPEHPAGALAMLRDLSAYLRHMLAGIRAPVVTLEAEVDALAAYLRIQQARFGERLRTRLEMDPAAAGRPIANGLLQPLAENAMEHGDRSDVLVLALRIGLQAGALRIEIENTGRLAPARGKLSSHGNPSPHGDSSPHGLGLANLRRRLDVHYPGRHSFDLRHSEDGPGNAGEPAGGARVIATLLLEGEPCSAS